MVLVAHPGVRELHLVAHRALMSMRTETHYWRPAFDAALAIWALTAHGPSDPPPPGSLDRLRREVLAEARTAVTSEEVVARAFAVAAERRMQQADRTAEAQVYDETARLAERGRQVVPALHVLLAAVALHESATEWPERLWTSLRGFFADGANAHADGALRVGYEATRQPLHADGLLNAAMHFAAVASSLGERCVAVWVLSFAIESTAAHADQPRFQLAVSERARAVEFLATEITPQSFEPLPETGFDPDAADSATDADTLTLFEAAILEAAIAPRQAGDAWLSAAEADVIYGGRVKRTARMAVGAVTFAAALACATFALAAHLTPLRPLAAGYGAVTAVAGAMLLAAPYLRAAGLNDRLTVALEGLFWTTLVTFALVGADQARPDPLLPDSVGVVVSIGLPAVIITILEVRAFRRR